MNVYTKPKGRLGRLISGLATFICALVIFFAVLFAIGAFIQADLQSQNILGGSDYQIFSYNRTDGGAAELQAFGESFTVDLTRINMLRDRFGEVSAVNKDYTPSLIILSGDILRGCISVIADSFGKLPDIISYFFGGSE